MRKTIQTLKGPVFVAGKSKECANRSCQNYGKHYYVSRVWLLSLPNSTYGLDVLTYIGWQHEHEHRQLVEIQRELNQRGVAINERNVGKLYRQFLALLSASSQEALASLKATAVRYEGGFMLVIPPYIRGGQIQAQLLISGFRIEFPDRPPSCGCGIIRPIDSGLDL